ncbi:MAG: carboxylesterase family protein [Myxococcota bacterium]|nr:carboxylesterase family protein [Myxococcota bacterium]
MRRSVWLLILGMGASACALRPEGPSGVVDPTSLRALSLGAVVGSAGRHGDHVWRSIPYAAAPVGERRWRAPSPPEPWADTLEALHDPAVCRQIATIGGGVDGADAGEPTGSEDCLYLNVFAPRFSPEAVPGPDARLPVMVWIHGGGNSIGDIAMYDGGRLASEHGVIVVALQYRLGPFGWFRHPALRTTGASDEARSGNFGTLDLIAALGFVREHITAFGGDPANVTIFGESAGGRNVITLLTSPAAGGLFHRAIVQSGSGRTTAPAVAENHVDDAEPGHVASSREIVLNLLIAEGGADNRAEARAIAAGMDEGETARFLRGQEAQAILEAYPVRGFGMLDMPQVFADGVVLPTASTFELFERGAYHQVPLMLGTTRDEGKTFQLGNPELVDLRLGVLPSVKDWDRYDREAEYGAKLWKAVGVDELARRAQAVQGPSVYAYRFDWDEEPTRLFLLDFSRLLGAAHGLDVFFVFGGFDVGALAFPFFDAGNEPGRVELSDRMMSYWAEFAHAGAPGRGRAGDLPEWSAWAQRPDETPSLMLLDSEAGGGVRMVAETVSAPDIVSQVASDARFPDDGARCAFLRRDRRGYLTEADVASVCAAVAAGPES